VGKRVVKKWIKKSIVRNDTVTTIMFTPLKLLAYTCVSELLLIAGIQKSPE
jgi:hypothetical protein